MANGFCLNGAACQQIRAERRLMRHLRNSLAATQPISVHNSASFPQHFATYHDPGELAHGGQGTHPAARALPLSRLSQPSEISGLFNVR
jgi:hypothetical protein